MPAERQSIHIVVVEGNGAINNIDVERAHAPVVKVVDGDGAPVANANVTFTLPSSGPGGEFLGGQQIATMRTDRDGTATARGLKPNHTAGQFQIRVVASADGETAHATITQTNVAPTVEKSRSKLYVILGVVAAGAAGGLIAATRGSKSSSSRARQRQWVPSPPERLRSVLPDNMRQLWSRSQGCRVLIAAFVAGCAAIGQPAGRAVGPDARTGIRSRGEGYPTDLGYSRLGDLRRRSERRLRHRRRNRWRRTQRW